MVTLVYNGIRYELDPALDITEVEHSLLERLNHIAHYCDRFDRRPYNRFSAVQQEINEETQRLEIVQQFDPVEVFPLRAGGQVRVFLHEGVNIALESDEAFQKPLSRFEDQR